MVDNMASMREKADSGEEPEPADFDLVSAFRSGEGRHRMRLQFAKQLEDIEAIAFGGKGGSTLVEGRNEKCLEVLQREIAAGKKRLGIYYGAAHMPHMEKRLTGDLGLRKVAQEWIVAWDCSPRPDPRFDRELWLRLRKARAEIASIAAAASAHRQRTGEVPTLQELTAAAPGAEPAYRGSAEDPWGHRYLVRSAGESGIEVLSAGPDGELGTRDDLETRAR
ncbi:MAG: hypothetical protein Fur0037_16370 [Planctomycetota bacterium]